MRVKRTLAVLAALVLAAPTYAGVVSIDIGAGSRLIWENQPAALTELFGNIYFRTRVDLSSVLADVKHAKVSTVPDSSDTSVVRPSDWNAAHNVKGTQARLIANVITAGVAGAQLRAQYSTDAVTWFYLDGSSGPQVAIDAATINTGGWVTLTAGAVAHVYLRIVGINGNGTADPEVGGVQLQFR